MHIASRQLATRCECDYHHSYYYTTAAVLLLKCRYTYWYVPATKYIHGIICYNHNSDV